MLNKRTFIFFSLLLFTITNIPFIPNAQTPTDPLYPVLKPYKTGYLEVSPVHSIFYQLGGNPKGKPVIYLHGGPGGSCSPFLFRYFNPEKFHIILHDQRGAGKSKPYAEIKENTTQSLVEDIEKLRKLLGLGKVLLVGGSWGSTLGLAYAETYPQNVSGMVLRGIFTATKEEIDFFYHGGTGAFFPQQYNHLVSFVDQPEKKNYPAQLLKKLLGQDPETSKKTAQAWAGFELKAAPLEAADNEIKEFLDNYNLFAFALIENYYMANNCFLQEGQLLKNADRLKDIRVILVNGRYDTICPPTTAYKLHQKIPGSELIIVEKAAHSERDTPIRNTVIASIKKFE